MSILIVGLILLALYSSLRFATSTIDKLGSAKSVSAYRIKYITKTVSLALMVFYAIVLLSFLGIEYSQVSIFLSSIFAVLGVALFAQWSILSNITASLIIFFGFPYRVGDKIKVVDKDDDISGVIEEIAMFHVLIRRGNELITYPNSLILQKAVVKRSAIEAVDEASKSEQVLDESDLSIEAEVSELLSDNKK
ncbi:mechanosensitive ion channel domain-containing protein [Echinimonas agarilytica]|uniref:Small-conductance mechanosensitive channel n=1 Tax=Echinimonas agarilytica TaxID=1215918 RepID=A0AA41W723_9GAMM|nr:mechanosensitive ion channel domain-containing protein [Echinimonas agarilytica]MCM2680292.1 mechanosensitive ion channel family protein [Echinimonas agarilytica]